MYSDDTFGEERAAHDEQEWMNATDDNDVYEQDEMDQPEYAGMGEQVLMKSAPKPKVELGRNSFIKHFRPRAVGKLRGADPD